MKIAVVDDEKSVFEQLQAYFNELPETAAELSYFESGEAFLASAQPDCFDLIVLDIFMKKLTGIEVARQIRQTNPTVKIVFSTSSNEYASESYEVNACYYLHKPFGKEQIKAMLDRLNLAEIERLRTATLPDGTRVILRNILFVDYAAHCITLHCKAQKNICARENFSTVEALLCRYPYFFSPTKGVIINFNEVLEKNKSTFQLSDGTLIPISRRKTKEAQDAYSTFLFEQLRKGGMS